MKKNICVVEDDQDVRFLLKKILIKEGFQVEDYANGYPLLDKEDNWPDLFILDIELPGINGLEICKWVKSHSLSAEIPVLFVSGSPELEVLAAQTEADAYLAKPVSCPVLMDKINTLLGEKVLIV